MNQCREIKLDTLSQRAKMYHVGRGRFPAILEG
ncbi:hypothetical protein [Citrobacter phage Tr1]|nr:hypothetical protein [Citrobacter phage Tr1]